MRKTACFVSLSFAGLVVLARSLNPIPSRTRPLNSSAPMVLWLKPWESRSLPGLPRTKQFLFTCHDQTERRSPVREGGVFVFDPVFLSQMAPGRLSAMKGMQLPSSWAVHFKGPTELPRNSKTSPSPRSLPCVSSSVPSPPR
jgi:hypothetical protein